MKDKFDRNVFLKESKNSFLNICKEIYKNTNYEPEFIDVLGKVIEEQFKKCDVEDVVNLAMFSNKELENAYEFDEENFSEYFDDKSIIKNYKQAIAYYSLNHLFIQEYEEYLDNELLKMSEEY